MKGTVTEANYPSNKASGSVIRDQPIKREKHERTRTNS